MRESMHRDEEVAAPANVRSSADPARVLIVHDHAATRARLRAVLRDEAALRVVGAATSGQEAISFARRLGPELIVLDDDLRGIRGLDILPRLRAVNPRARTVLSTTSVTVAQEARALGAAAVVTTDDDVALIATLRQLAASR
jgi:DNA-binding NarL/FixJ family response regulator